METKKIKGQKLKSTQIWIAILVTVSSLLGSFSALTGGLAISLLTALLLGIFCLIYFIWQAKAKTFDVFTVNQESTAPIGDKEIPDDRIDLLTGLANENGLNAWFQEKSPRLAADGKGIVVLSADLAGFEQVERVHGKQIADAVLIEVAKRVASCAGPEGIAARTSGDEFAAIANVVPKYSNEIAAEQAGKLAEMLQRPVELPTGVVWIGGSVGVAAGSPQKSDVILARARDALGKAKILGRGHYVVDNQQREK